MENDEKQYNYHCRECGREFPKELVEEFILKNKTAYCESCGFPFKLSPNGDKFSSGFKRTKSPRIQRTQPIVRRTPIISQEKSHLNKATPNNYANTNYPQNQQANNLVKKPEQYPKKWEHKPTKIPEKDLSGMKTAIGWLNNVNESPILIIVAVVVSVARLIGVIVKNALRVDPFDLQDYASIAINLIVFILILTYIREKMISKIKEGDHSNLGIDFIIYGAIACSAYGLGAFAIAEGIVILLYEIFTRNNELIDKKKHNPRDISAEIMARTIHIFTDEMYKSTFYIILLGLPIVITIRGLIGGTFWAYVIFLIFSIFLLDYIKKEFILGIKGVPFDNIKTEFLVKSTIFASICLANGSGAILLTTCILCFIHKNTIEEIKKERKLKQNARRTVQLERPSEIETIKKPETVIPIVAVNNQEIPKQEISDYNLKQKLPLDQIPSEDFKSKDIEEKSELSSIPSSKSVFNESIDKEKYEPTGKILGDPDKEAQINLYLSRIFTVLSGETRQRILELDVPEKEKYELVKEFVNLTEEKQKKYLEELELINRKISWELIQKIKKMEIDEAEKQKLIDQLKFMTPEGQIDFINFLTSEH